MNINLMTIDEKLKLIEEKEKEIKAIKAEIKELRGTSIRALCKNDFIDMFCICTDGATKVMHRGDEKKWDLLRQLSTRIHSKWFVLGDDSHGYSWFDGDEYIEYVTLGTLKVKEMTQEQRKLSAEFCDEVIEIYNKFVKKAAEVATPRDEFIVPHGFEIAPFKKMKELHSVDCGLMDIEGV